MKKQILTLCATVSCMALFAGSPDRNWLGPVPAFSSTSEPPGSGQTKKFSIDEYDDDAPKNVIKINTSQILFRNLSFQYERALHENLSVACGISFFLQRPLPKAYYSDDDPSGEGLRSPVYGGWSITPELRYYPAGDVDEHPSPHGFYIAAYLRYSKYKLTSEFYENYSNGMRYGYDYKLEYKGTNVGLMLGSQWIIGKHFSIDWWIIGGGYGLARFKMEAVTSGYTMDASEQAEVQASVEEEFDNSVIVFGRKAEVTTTSNSIKAVVRGVPMLSIRGFGLCLGFAF